VLRGVDAPRRRAPGDRIVPEKPPLKLPADAVDQADADDHVGMGPQLARERLKEGAAKAPATASRPT
jgi:hypothetical protein